MFVRKKKNRSGVISVQVVDKSSGHYRVIHTVGSSANALKLQELFQQGHQWIRNKTGSVELDFQNEAQAFNQFVNGIQSIQVTGVMLLLGKLFDQIGFNQLNEPLFRQLVMFRLCFPASKLKTTDYLQRYNSTAVDVEAIYRYLDRLHKHQREQVQQISYNHTLKILNNQISVIFYDVTTLYFEIDDEDHLRKTGFSKEGKHQHPQIVLGLLVSVDGYPLAYEIFEGNKFEGHTMLPVIDAFKEKYNLKDLIIVADSGLLSNANVHDLQSKNYQYILGARIKNETEAIKEKIFSLSLSNGQSEVIDKDNYGRLILTYSESRAKKDKANREKGLRKLEKQIKTGKLTKASLNNRGYNKFLRLEGTLTINLNEAKIKEDCRWDGLKGYLTNTSLSKKDVIDNYKHLWKIEKAFRISKTELKIRPIYHRLQRRIEAHICIAFVAYKVYKELERQLAEKQAGISAEKAIEIAKAIYSIKVITPASKQVIEKVLYLTEEQRKLAGLFDF
ncbi:MAG: IS1634 family transposase [Chitinophagaceae bacterium]